MNLELQIIVMWEKLMAGYIRPLSPNDLSDYNNYFSVAESQKIEEIPVIKRQDWLLGRLALKRLTAEYLTRIEAQSVSWSNIELILEGQDRFLSIAGEKRRDLAVSLSHTRSELAAAVIGSRASLSGVGIDIESIRKFDETFVERFMNEKEYADWSRLPVLLRPEQATLVWCLKEAWGKALGTGLGVNPKRFDTRQLIGQEKTPKTNGKITVCWTKVEKDYIIVILQLNNTHAEESV